MKIAIYGFMYLPANTKSYVLGGDILQEEEVSYVPLIVFSVLRFCTTITLLVWTSFPETFAEICVLIAKLRFVIQFRCPFRCSANFTT